MIRYFRTYINLSLLNLTIVASIGLLMRYKIGFEFPYFDQKFLQHAHSHFAFAGWITHTLYIFIIHILSKEILGLNLSKYLFLVKLNLLCAYGMLFSFATSGYDTISIIFSSTTILISFIFSGFYFYDIVNRKASFTGQSWFTAAFIFAIISAAGTTVVAYMMSTGNINMDLYIASIYYYLHFQYNGWFFFSCMGLTAWKLNLLVPGTKISPVVFKLFAFACVPAYFLSVLWLDIPGWLFIVIIISALMQVIAFIKFIRELMPSIPVIKSRIAPFLQGLFLFAGMALMIKLILQLFSTIPALSDLAFGFRTIVIAYLHLVLLAFISVFLLTYMFLDRAIPLTAASRISMLIITGGIFLNELILLIQGISSFTYTLVPYANEGLVIVSGIIFTGMVMLLMSNSMSKYQTIETVK